METAIKCSREGEHHGGPLRKVDGQYVCQECWAKEQGIEVKQAKGRPVVCPSCGEVLMTRFRGGKININSLSMKGTRAILSCKCGYKKSVNNPFGKTVNRDEAAKQKFLSQKGA